MLLLCVLETRLVLVRVRRHQALNRNQDWLQALCGWPLFTTLSSPCSVEVSINVLYPISVGMCYPRIDLWSKLAVVFAKLSRGGNSQANFALGIDIRIESASSTICSCRNDWRSLGWIFCSLQLVIIASDKTCEIYLCQTWQQTAENVSRVIYEASSHIFPIPQRIQIRMVYLVGLRWGLWHFGRRYLDTQRRELSCGELCGLIWMRILYVHVSSSFCRSLNSYKIWSALSSGREK